MTCNVYEHYFKEKIEEEGLKTSLIGLVESYLKNIENRETDEVKWIKQVIERIKDDRKVKWEIEEVKTHEWVKMIEGEVNQNKGGKD